MSRYRNNKDLGYEVGVEYVERWNERLKDGVAERETSKKNGFYTHL